MSNHVVEMDSFIRFHGKRYTIPELNAAFNIGSDLDALATAQVLVNKGNAQLEVNKTKEQKTFEKVATEENWVANANQHDLYVEAGKDFAADQKREGRARYDNIEIDYPHLLKAQEHQDLFIKQLRLRPDQIEIRVKTNLVTMVIFDITDAELNYISRTYKADKAIGSALGFMESGVGKATGAIDYAATKVAAPVVQIGARAGVSVLKSIATTLAKVSSSAVVAVSQGAKTAAHEIKTDPDVLRGGRELLQVKDAAMRTMNRGGSSAAGIRVNQ